MAPLECFPQEDAQKDAQKDAIERVVGVLLDATCSPCVTRLCQGVYSDTSSQETGAQGNLSSISTSIWASISKPSATTRIRGRISLKPLNIGNRMAIWTTQRTDRKATGGGRQPPRSSGVGNVTDNEGKLSPLEDSR